MFNSIDIIDTSCIIHDSFSPSTGEAMSAARGKQLGCVSARESGQRLADFPP
jgi:hypothetical protein